MIIPAICFIGGLVAMGRTKPQTGVRKLLCLGPRSGLVYPVEDFPEIGVVVVRAPNKSAVAQFLRLSVREPGKPGLIYQQGQGDAQLLELIRQDFAVAPKLAAVGPEAASDKRQAASSDSASVPKPETGAPGAFRGEGVGTRSPKPSSAPPIPPSKASTPSGI